MFSRLKRPHDKPKDNEIIPSTPRNSDAQAVELENLCHILKEYGRHAFDIETAPSEETRDICDKWVMHLQYGAPQPNTPDCTPMNPDKKDWSGLRGFFAKHRQAESRYVTKSFNNMNQVIWAFIQGLKTTLSIDQDSDQRAKEQLGKLEKTAKSGNIDEIRYEVQETVANLSNIIKERQARQKAQTDQLYTQIKDLGVQLQEAKEESARDPLTKLYNRVVFDSELTRSIDMHRIFRQPSCLLMIDLDHFKTINDLYGHAAGDKALKNIADILIMSFPRKTDTISRYGGEEFAIILPDTNLEIGLHMGERMLNAIRNLEINQEGDIIHITASAGITEVGENETPEKWMDRADRALYQAKNGGRNRLSIGYHFLNSDVRKAG